MITEQVKPTIAVWILPASVICSLYLYPKANTEIQYGPKIQSASPSKSANRIMDGFWFCYHTELSGLHYQISTDLFQCHKYFHGHE